MHLEAGALHRAQCLFARSRGSARHGDDPRSQLRLGEHLGSSRRRRAARIAHRPGGRRRRRERPKRPSRLGVYDDRSGSIARHAPLRGAGQSGLFHSEIVELRKRLVLAFHLAGFGFHGAGALLLTLRGSSKRCGLLSLHVLVLAQEANREDAVDRWQVEGDEAEGGRRG